MCRALCQTSGSCRCTHTTFGAVKPVRASLPVIWISLSRPTRSRISSHSSDVRWSFQRIAGRSTPPSSPTRTSPCICPVSPTPLMDVGSMPVSPSTFWMLSVTPSHQSWGSCSLHRGRGVSKAYSVEAVPATVPASSMRSALVAVVETSMPSRWAIGRDVVRWGEVVGVEGRCWRGESLGVYEGTRVRGYEGTRVRGYEGGRRYDRLPFLPSCLPTLLTFSPSPRPEPDVRAARCCAR